MSPRIAFVRIASETNAFSPVATTMDDFRRLHFLEGAALGEACRPWRPEVRGLLRNGELSGFVRSARRAGAELVPLFSAWALPSGPLAERTYEELRERLVAGLRAAGHLDGVYFCFHGAMRGHGRVVEPEEGFLAAIREVVGPEVPIAASIDLHAQLTPAKVAIPDLLVSYRTNPHRDLARTGQRAAQLLLKMIRREIRPTTAWRSVPMVKGGGHTFDFIRPMRSIFRRLSQMERRDPRVLHTSLCMVHPWNDSPDLGWSTHVLTDGAPELAEALADEIAELAWGVREIPIPDIFDLEAGLTEVRKAWLARRLGTVCVVDASDVVGAGAPGENTRLLAGLLERAKDLRAYVPLRDKQTVEQLWDRPVGSELTMEVGGRLDPVRSPPVEVRGRLKAKQATEHFGRALVLDLDHVQLVVTEDAPFTLRPSFYADLGLEPRRADLVVVKSFFHFRLYYLGVSRKVLGIKTHGATDFDLTTTLQFNDPVYPKDAVEDWRAVDRRRRARPVP